MPARRLEVTVSRRAMCVVAVLLVLVHGCGGGEGGVNTPPPPPPPPPPSPPLVLAKGVPSGDAQAAIVSSTLPAPLRVRATRGTGPAVGEAVTWSTTSGQVVGSGATGADGIATGTWTLGGVIGTHTATATSGAAAVQFTATATAPPQANLAIAKAQPSGDGQSAPLGTLLPDPLRVIVTQNGVPVAGQVVTWQTSAANGFFDPAQAATGQDGIALGRWTLGTPVGEQAATATLTAQSGGASVAFAATATGGQGGGTVEIHLTLSGGARFAPANVVITAGTTVRWIWDDGPHTVTSNGQPSFSDSPAADNPPRTFEFTFTQPGTYQYYCTVHGSPGSGMRGTVVVQ